jgi:hypothetical protein
VHAALASFAYLVFACYLTWPLVTDLDGRIYGAVGDLTGAIATHRELSDTGNFGFTAGTLGDFNAPDGLDIRWSLNLVTLPSFGALHLLVLAFGPIAATGIYVLAGFTLSGLAMFLLVRRLTGHAGVAFVAGFAYAFFPFVVVKGQGHIDYVHGWVLVVAAWRMLELMERPTVRNGIWVGLALVLAFAWTPYHIIFGAVMLAGVGAVALVLAIRRNLVRPTIVALAIGAAIGLAWPAGMALVDRASPGTEIRAHTIREAVAFSARAAEYVVPTAQHPLFGDPASDYRSSHLHGSNASENTLYVGISVLLLALVGLVAAIRRGGTQRRLALAAAGLVVAGFAASAPPEVDLLGVTFPTTTKLLFEITSTWRVFSRLVVVVMLGLVLLASLGMLAIVRNRTPRVQLAVLTALLALVAADLWARSPEPTNRIVVPGTYLRLAKLPPGIAVEYPLLPAESTTYGDVFYQGWHDKPILNGYRIGAGENRALHLSDLESRDTTRGLQALRVRYVLVRRDLKAAGLPDPGTPGRDFRLVTEDSYLGLYELRARGGQVLVTPGDHFGPPEVGARGDFNWLLDGDGNIDLRGSCTVCEGVLSFSVGSFHRPRTMTLYGPGRRVLLRRRVADPQVVRTRIRFNRAASLRIESDPGVEPISAATASDDPRSVGLYVGRTSFNPSESR